MKAFLRAILQAMASSVAVYEQRAYPYPHLSSRLALRGDWMRIGRDFRAVMSPGRDLDR